MENKLYIIIDLDDTETIDCSNNGCIGVFSSKEKALQGFRKYFNYRKSTLIYIGYDNYIAVDNVLSTYQLQEFELDKV